MKSEALSFDEKYEKNLKHTRDIVSRGSCHDTMNFLQLDGSEDLDVIDKRKPEKKIYGINCEISEITQLINLIRSFNFLWISQKTHLMCLKNPGCFFCYIRSSCLRLRKERSKGPKLLQLNEFANQLDQYLSTLNWDWKEHMSDLPDFIENTLRLISFKQDISTLFRTKDKNCIECKQESDGFLIKVESKEKAEDEEILEINDLIQKALLRKNHDKKCFHQVITQDNLEELCIFIKLSHAVSVNVTDGEKYYGVTVSYRSHAEIDEDLHYHAFFRYDNQMYKQEEDGSIFKSFFGVHRNVILISLFLTNDKGMKVMENVDEFIFGDETQKQLRKKYQKFISPQNYNMKQMLIRKKDQERDLQLERKAKKSCYDQTPERKAKKALHDQNPERKTRKSIHDKVRDSYPDRKAKKSEHDKIRDQNPDRKKMHQKINKREYRKVQLSNYEQTEARRIYNNIRNKKKYQELLSLSLLNDTGFDVVCSSCLQYKSKDFCKPISRLSREKITKYIIRFCFILKNRTEGQFICNACFNDIKKNKTPKKSHVNNFNFANYPRSFLLKVKQKCTFKECEMSKKCKEDPEQYERKVLKLNKLEAYLLKLVIPFIRIAHCPRGPYLKVKGDLILISSNIDHSLTKILPSEQGLIPVSFKRKLSYSGSYLEEYVEKEKVKIYFAWLRKHNHLYKDIELDSRLMDSFFSDSIEASKEFQSNTREELYESDDNEENEENNASMDVCESYFKDDTTEYMEPQNLNDADWTHNQTTMFLNKYCENTNIPSVANKMADIIIDYEINQGISIEKEDDFEIDDEVITEEEFLRNVELDRDEEVVDAGSIRRSSSSENELDIQDSLPTRANDEIVSNLDMFVSPSEEQSQTLSDEANKEVKNIMSKMEKMCVAPGEGGGFNNWGDDIFLEEKCFPEHFPYGTGGYLSTCMNSENKTGFAAYCVNQILSADSKFRMDTSYLFFLLLVKELIQLKRCKNTYFRQATKLPNLTKNDICNTDRENLNRYNRSFQVFKSVRGTSMNYEQSKKNLMALLHQQGCPSVFLTLSCAEFDWPELLKEIAETVYRRKFTTAEIDNLSNTEKNKLISENTVQSTMHFQRRVEKLFGLMGYDFFEGNNEAYHVSSYFFRVEFQQRGAPHIHSLLWLKNRKGKDAPNFWIDSDDHSDDENVQKIDNVSRIKEIEKFADLLITTSPDEIFCKEHNAVKNRVSNS